MSPLNKQTVQITFIGALRAIFNRRSDEIEIPAVFTIGDVVSALAAKYGEIVEYHLLDADGRFRQNVVILADGVRVNLEEGLGTPLTGSTKTELVVMEAIGGG